MLFAEVSGAKLEFQDREERKQECQALVGNERRRRGTGNKTENISWFPPDGSLSRPRSGNGQLVLYVNGLCPKSSRLTNAGRVSRL